VNEFLVNDPHELLTRIQRGRDRLAQGPVLDLGEEILDHRQRDVRLDERHPHIAQGITDVFLRELCLARDAAERLGKPFG
jgi:hypothetical protein